MKFQSLTDQEAYKIPPSHEVRRTVSPVWLPVLQLPVFFLHGLTVEVPGQVVKRVLVALATLALVATRVETLALQGDALHTHPNTKLRQTHTYKIIIIIDNFCIALFAGVHKLTALYNILQHFLSFTNIIRIIMTTNKV